MEMAAIHGLTTAIQILFEQFGRQVSTSEKDRLRELVKTAAAGIRNDEQFGADPKRRETMAVFFEMALSFNDDMAARQKPILTLIEGGKNDET